MNSCGENANSIGSAVPYESCGGTVTVCVLASRRSFLQQTG